MGGKTYSQLSDEPIPYDVFLENKEMHLSSLNSICLNIRNTYELLSGQRFTYLRDQKDDLKKKKDSIQLLFAHKETLRLKLEEITKETPTSFGVFDRTEDFGEYLDRHIVTYNLVSQVPKNMYTIIKKSISKKTKIHSTNNILVQRIIDNKIPYHQINYRAEIMAKACQFYDIKLLLNKIWENI